MTATDASSDERRLLAEGCAAALAGLVGMGPRRLAAALDRWEPEEAWARVCDGDLGALAPSPAQADLHGRTEEQRLALAAAWARAARQVDVRTLAEHHRAAGASVLLRTDVAYPEVLLADIEPPAVLFVQGDLGALDGPRAAIVGTRRCTGVGAGFARELGRELAAQGVAIVSGLALGIDGAAHRGALDSRAAGEAAAPVGVVGSGLDVVYPARHRDLWESVREHGVLLSEAPLGDRPNAWRFPARNRIIAALADVVIVVESHRAGGSLHTVEEAQRRSIPVMAVPGSIRSPAAVGTNALLADGCHPVADAGDVLIALGLNRGQRRASREARPTPDPIAKEVLAAFDWEPATLEHLTVRTGRSLPEISLALEALQATGWVRLEGGWYEQVSSR